MLYSQGLHGFDIKGSLQSLITSRLRQRMTRWPFPRWRRRGLITSLQAFLRIVLLLSGGQVTTGGHTLHSSLSSSSWCPCAMATLTIPRNIKASRILIGRSPPWHSIIGPTEIGPYRKQHSCQRVTTCHACAGGVQSPYGGYFFDAQSRLSLREPAGYHDAYRACHS